MNKLENSIPILQQNINSEQYNKSANKLADKIVDKNYQKNKSKLPFVQAAENAVKELSFGLKDGFIENNAGNARLDNVGEAIDINEGLDKNFKDQKQDSYLALIESNKLAAKETPKQTWEREASYKGNRAAAMEAKRLAELQQKDDLDQMEHFGIEHANVKHPDFPKSPPKPRLTPAERRKNLYNKKYGISKQYDVKKENGGVKYVGSRQHLYDEKDNNPTVNKYKAFKEKQKKALEDKKFNENFKKEYSDAAINKWLRAKEHKNIKAGKKPYDGFSTNNIIVAEHNKDQARKSLAAIKDHHIKLKLEPTYIDYRLAMKDTGPTMSLDEHMAKVAPKVIDPGGITDLRGVRKFRDTMEFANEKFPRNLGGGLAPLLGEDN